MRSRGRSRSAMVIISSSSFLFIVTAAMILSSAGLSRSIRINEDDLDIDGYVGTVELDIRIMTLLMIEVDSKESIGVTITIYDDDRDIPILSRRGTSPMTIQKRIENPGRITLTILIENEEADFEDIGLEVAWTGLGSVLMCIGSILTLMIALPLLAVGSLQVIMEIRNAKDCGKGTGRSKR